MRPALWGCLLGAALSCVACAPQRQPEAAIAAASTEFLAAQRGRVDSLRSWKARGDIVMRGARAVRGWRGRFYWEQAGRRFKMRISSLLGGTLMMVSGEFGGEVNAIAASGERRRADTPEQLVREMLGVEVPVTNLRYWIAGAPAYGARAYDAFAHEGRLRSFGQSGWRVRYAAWHSPHQLPERLVLSSERDDDASIAISIRSWEDVTWVAPQ